MILTRGSDNLFSKVPYLMRRLLLHYLILKMIQVVNDASNQVRISRPHTDSHYLANILRIWFYLVQVRGAFVVQIIIKVMFH